MAMESTAELAQRMRNTIEEIERIQRELSHPSADPQTRLAAPQVPLETVSELKCCVDQSRLFLWAYIDGRDPAQSVNAERPNY